ncbi:RNA polymerase sigma factor [Streptomyces nojiriensis]|uniref:RNA polymerase sigma factor n=1 Tax=Streptomyces nojiriensis TaxID=66374 RepID=UPI0036CD098B
MTLSLCARVRLGDPAAFGQIFDEGAPLIREYALRHTCDWVTAEDVVSTTFLEAWLLRKSCPSEGDFVRPWLHDLAAGVLRSYTSIEGMNGEVLAQPLSGQVVPDIAEEVVDRLTDAEQLAVVRGALKRLRQEERDVFALRVGAGLAHAEIADALGVAEGTIRARLSRGRHRLRELTEQERVRREWRHGRSVAMGRVVPAPGTRRAGTRSPPTRTGPLPQQVTAAG